MIVRHFVRFLSPGTFCSEERMLPIADWDVATAVAMSADIVERNGARPFGFQFVTRGRRADELDSREIDKSGIYYLGGQRVTREEIEARNLPGEETLRWNIRANNIAAVVVNSNSYTFTAPLDDNDVILDMEPSR